MKKMGRQYQYLFGPIPSRRLGLSLGIDLLPSKTCSLDCVYCECGRTTDLTIQRKDYVPYEHVIKELADYLSQEDLPDVITFAGSGEPTLHLHIGEIINYLKTNFPHLPVALLTNSTLFYDDDLCRDILPVDIIIASVDAVSAPLFQKINRPHESLTLETFIKHINKFQKQYQNQFFIEYFVIPGLNETTQALNDFKAALPFLSIHNLQINTLDRPGTEKWVKPLSQKKAEAILSLLTGQDAPTIPPLRTEQRNETEGKLSKNNDDQDIHSMLSLLKRRPLTAKDISIILNISEQEALTRLNQLTRQNLVYQQAMPRGNFYLIS